MSNGAVGNLYNRIIEAVLDSSRTDFEESGVDGRTIEEMREIWQRQLSVLGRAQFPWEPEKTETAAAPSNGTATASSSATPAATAAPANPQPKQEPASVTTTASSVTSQAPAGSSVKQEQSFDASFLNLPPTGAYNQNPHYAQQRAINNIQQKFGSQAGGQFAANGVAQNGSSQSHPSPTSQQPPSKRIKTEGGLSSSQTDGAGDDPADDWRNIMNEHSNVTPAHRKAADGMMRRHVLENQNKLEAGGLLVPLDQHYQSLSASKSKDEVQPSGQYDGPDDSDDEEKYPDEEDAINSDLDDPEEENVENMLAGDGPEGDTILCLYDKVQRVKNKWKCQLKDGVCTIDGKDYVFHKANGEFEW